MASIDDTNRLDAIRLIRTENVGPVTYRHLLDRFGTASAAVDALPALARNGGRTRPLKVPTRAEAAREMDAASRAGARVLIVGEPDYPLPLAALADAPPVLFAAGHVPLLSRPAVAIVGARNASANGRRFAQDLAAELSGRGLLVVSGLARGIDAAAHRGALDAGTAAVVAGGVDVTYPPEHDELQREIASRGVVVAEQPPGVAPQARHFPRRNRLISGLSLGVCVVEAAQKSGSLITARFALEQGREVLAVPGSPLDPRCRGTNDLIRAGATLIQSADDVMEALGPQRLRADANRLCEPSAQEAFGSPSPEEAVVARARRGLIELLGPSPVAVDELIRQHHVPAAIVATILLELELAGRLERHPGNQVSLIAGAGIGRSQIDDADPSQRAEQGYSE